MAADANVILRIREDDAGLKQVIESFSDGTLVGVEIDGPDVVLSLRVSGESWPAQISQVEARLDQLAFDWRAAVSCHQA